MKRIIIFRFHKHPKICENRVELLKKLNPNMPIHGIYGGEEKQYATFKKKLGPYLNGLFCIRGKDSNWKWLNFDLALRNWYKQTGKNIDFDMAHVVEWDLILCESMEKIYSNIKKNEVGVTGLTRLKKVENVWDWTSQEPYKSRWKELLKRARREHNYSSQPYASIGPGCCLPKIFLKKYSETEVPELCHDELRIPLYSQIFGLKIKDTGFYRKWYDKDEEKYFNCMDREISIATMKKELKKKNGRRAFHPFRKIFNLT